MALSPWFAGLTAAFVGFGGSVAVVLAACAAVGATTAETASWIAGLCLATGLASGLLSIGYRLPIVAAWSTPGAALIAASTGPQLTMETAVGAFIVAAVLILATAAIAPLGRLIERLPMPIAGAVLAGVLLRLVAGPFENLPNAPALILPLVVLFLALRILTPTLAVIGVLAGGFALAGVLGLLQPLPPLRLTTLTWVSPRFDAAVALGLGVPLYLVTMASQNLAGYAVLRASGYAVIPTRAILAVTGGLSLLTAPVGAHTSNLAAISGAICTGPDCHPDHARRWWSGVAYMMVYLLFAAVAPSLVAVFAALPPDLVRTVAGLALAAPLAGALTTAFSGTHDKMAPALTFAVVASGVSIGGVGAAFWGLLAGLAVQSSLWLRQTDAPK